MAELKNGAVTDDETGRFIQGPPGGGPAGFTPGPDGTGYKAVTRKYQIQREAFASGIVEGVMEGEDFDPREGDALAWKEVGRRAGQVLMQANNARGMSELLRAIAEFSGYAPGKAEAPQTVNNTLITAGANRELARLIAEAAGRPLSEGEVVDGLVSVVEQLEAARNAHIDSKQALNFDDTEEPSE